VPHDLEKNGASARGLMRSGTGGSPELAKKAPAVYAEETFLDASASDPTGVGTRILAKKRWH
jgi:hypothetical protein